MGKVVDSGYWKRGACLHVGGGGGGRCAVSAMAQVEYIATPCIHNLHIHTCIFTSYHIKSYHTIGAGVGMRCGGSSAGRYVCMYFPCMM